MTEKILAIIEKQEMRKIKNKVIIRRKALNKMLEISPNKTTSINVLNSPIQIGYK